MNDSLFDQIQMDAKYLNIDLCSQEAAQLAMENKMSDESVMAISQVFSYLKAKKAELKQLVKMKAEAETVAAKRKAEEDKKAILDAVGKSGKSVEEILELLK